MNMQIDIERERLDGFMLELNASGFSNPEISRQVGRSLSFVEKFLNGKKQFIWKLSPPPPLHRRWVGGTERSSMELKRMKRAIGENLWWLWAVKAIPAAQRDIRRRAAVRPHRALVAQAVEVLSLLCGVGPAEIWRWIYPGRERHIYRHSGHGLHRPKE